MARVQAHCLHGSLRRFGHAGVGRVHGFPGSCKLKQRVDKIGHLVYAGPNLLIELLTLRRSQASITKKLGISDDSRQRMAKVMRD